jgi:hypothetical protein
MQNLIKARLDFGEIKEERYGRSYVRGNEEK